MTASGRARAHALVAVVGLGALLALLLRVGGPPPSLEEVDGADPVAVIFSLLRLVAVATCGYLLAATSLGLAARLAGCRAAVHRLDRLTLPSVRRLLRDVAAAGALSAAVGAGAAVGPSLAFAQAPRPPALHQLPDPTNASTLSSPSTPSTPSPTAAPSGPVTLHQLDDPAPAPTPDPPIQPPPTPPAPPAPTTAPPVPATAAVWEIAPGDHLWHVSQATLLAARGRPPTDAETVVYLRALVGRNRGVFAVPGDADLVFPGQRFELPTP